MKQTTFVKRPIRFLALCLILSLTFSLASCFNSGRNAAVEDFRQAITTGNESLARDIYVEQRTRKGFDKALYVTVVEEQITEIGRQYSEGKLKYDQASLTLETLQFHPEITDELTAKIAEVQAILQRGDAISGDLEQAQIFVAAKDYEPALQLYDKILETFPEHPQVRTERATALGEYVLQTDTRASELAGEGYPRTALAIVEKALTYDNNNQALLTRKATLVKSIAAKDAEIRAEIPKIELNALLKNGDLLGAQQYLDKISEQGVDVSLLQPLLDERVNLYITAVLESASSLASTNISGRWTVNPYRAAIAKLDEALNFYPSDESLLAAKARYESLTPNNAIGDVSVTMGSVTRDATGTDANGYTYESGGFDEALAIKPDVTFRYTMSGYSQTRIIISPKTADTAVYNNMSVRIVLDGAAVLDEMAFANSLGTIDLTLDTNTDSVIEIQVRQSGFASFFEGIIGRNQLFVELYRLN